MKHNIGAKFFLIFSLIFCFSISLCFAAETTEEITLEDKLNVQIYDSTQVIDQIEKGSIVTITETKDSWAKIKYGTSNDKEGWCLASLLKTSSSNKFTDKLYEKTLTYTVGGNTFTVKGYESDYEPVTSSLLIFNDEEHSRIHPEFAKRLEKLAQALGGPIPISSGFRSMELQARLIANDYGKPGYTLGEDGSLFYKGSPITAKPGTSNHGKGTAVDVKWAGDVGSTINRMPNEKLEEYGLYRPMDYETWHIQPVEVE